jgi:hypothetical protein
MRMSFAIKNPLLNFEFWKAVISSIKAALLILKPALLILKCSLTPDTSGLPSSNNTVRNLVFTCVLLRGEPGSNDLLHYCYT